MGGLRYIHATPVGAWQPNEFCADSMVGLVSSQLTQPHQSTVRKGPQGSFSDPWVLCAFSEGQTESLVAEILCCEFVP
jgi:hypothetical protein